MRKLNNSKYLNFVEIKFLFFKKPGFKLIINFFEKYIKWPGFLC